MAKQPIPAVLASAVVTVGYGRGFVVERRMHRDRVVITAAHCLPWFPPPRPGAHSEELTYQRLLGPLRAKPKVWTELLFADPVADIAVLGSPDDQSMSEQADAYETLLASAQPLAIAEAPAQYGFHATECDARVLSLDGRWRDGRIARTRGWLAFSPEKFFESGMSGSPIINMSGKAIGVVSVDGRSPVLVDGLSTGLLRSINRPPLRVRPKAWALPVAQ